MSLKLRRFSFPEDKELMPPNHEKEKSSVPKVLLIFEQVRKEMDADRGTRPVCPDAVIREVLKSEDPKAKIAEVKQALDEIARAAGKWAWDAVWALEYENVARMFVNHTKEFVEMARVAGDAFWALRNENIAGMFVQNPRAVIDAFGEIARAAGEGNGARNAFYGLGDTNLKVDKKLLDSLSAKLNAEQKSFEPFIARYGIRPMKVAGYLDEKPGILDGVEYNAGYEKEVRTAVLKIAKEKKIDPEFLAAAVFQEGYVLHMQKKPDDYTIDSFGEMGMDAFHSDLQALKDSDYIRMDFNEGREFKVLREETNEGGFTGKTVVFKDASAVIEAFGAMLAQRRDIFIKAVREMGQDPEKLSREQMWAGAYLFYNAVDPKQKLRELGPENLLTKYEGGQARGYRYNYMRVVCTAAYLKSLGILAETAEEPMKK